LSTEGYVYILTNPAMPRLVRIGKTECTVIEHVKELNATRVPAPFKIVHQRKVEHMDQVERDMHQHFYAHRETRGGEFFKVTSDAAIVHLDALDKISAARPEWLDTESKRRFKKPYAELLVSERELVGYGVDYMMNETICKGVSYQAFEFTSKAASELARLEAKAVCARADFENNQILRRQQIAAKKFTITAMKGIGAITAGTFVVVFGVLALFKAL
jgi:hypothetical protein